ncbi:MAG: hypothetical protein Q8O99_07765 [bacterium]|nr:hypothetical protein [bacterium]
MIYQPTPVYDPGVKVSCAPSATNEYSCGDILTCTATFSNSPSNQAVQSFIGAAFGLMNATVTQIVSTQGDISCQSVSSGTPQVACEGSIAVNSSSSVTFMVQLSDCVTCQYLPSYIEVYGYLDVNTPTDPNLTNNFSSWTSPFTCS